MTNHAIEISVAVDAEIASWRRVFGARKPGVDARELLRNATRELWSVLKIDGTVHPESEQAARQEAIDALQDQPAQGAEVIDIATGAPITDVPAGLTIKSSKQFVAGFVPPDYTVDGLLQEGFLYSLTGQTGEDRNHPSAGGQCGPGHAVR